MQAIQIAARMVAGHGDEVLVPVPAWPNIAAAIAINGGVPVGVPLRFGNDGWRIDLDQFFAAATERRRSSSTRLNPTGWTSARNSAILDFARSRGLFIVADEVYAASLRRPRALVPRHRDLTTASSTSTPSPRTGP
jgi:aspartate/methionine/tyrosine aminotransferase